MRYFLFTLLVIFLVSCGRNTIEESHVCFTASDCLSGYECKFDAGSQKNYGKCVELESCTVNEDCSSNLLCDENLKKCLSSNIMIKTTALDSANRGIDYSYKITFAGIKDSHYYFEALEELPDGLTLSEEGVISGIPNEMGSYKFNVRLYGHAKEEYIYYGKEFVEKTLTIEVLGDICDPNPCTETNKGKCTQDSTKDDGYFCSCDDGFVLVGDNCIVDICNNPENPCKDTNKTSCTPTDDNISYTCSCDDGYYENTEGLCVMDHCFAEVNPCEEENRNKCINDENEESGYKCECNEGFTEYEAACIEDVCAVNPCTDSLKNKCIIDLEEDTNYRCECKDSFYEDENGQCLYDYCDVLNPCDSNVDTFKTKCVNNENEADHYVCECSDRFDTNEQGECFFNPCKVNRCRDEFRTTCIPTGEGENDYECACDDGYALNDSELCYPIGDLCETAIEITQGVDYQGDTTSMHANYVATCGSYARSNDAVYKFTLTDDKIVTATMTSLEESQFNTVLHIKDSCESTSNEFGCSDKNVEDINSSRLENIFLEAGTYYLFADGYATSNTGSYTINFETADPCYSDSDCTDNTTFCDIDSHLCKDNKCLQGDLVCENGSCNRLDATCKCNEGFINSDDFTCIPDPCFEVACTENSTCVVTEDLSSYTCECDQNFIKTNAGTCLQNPCAPTNSCTEEYRTKCSYNVLEDSIETICSCDDDFLDVDGVCTASIMNTCPGLNISPNQVFVGDTTPLDDTYQPDPDESTYSAAGNDAVYKFTLTKLSAVTVTLNYVGTSWDRSLYIRKNSCTNVTAQVGYSDGFGAAEEIEDNFGPGTYYIFVDGYSSSSKGKFSLELKVEPLCQDNRDCEGDNQFCNSSTSRCECANGFGFGSDLECHEECVDLGSSYFVCSDNLFECNLSDSLCYRKTECDNECQANSTCNLDTLNCDCNEGFTLNEDGECVSDLCILNNVECLGDFVSCEKVTGLCVCDEGYENYVNGSGCTEDTDPCTPGIKCQEDNKTICNPVSLTEYECLCDDGFIENGEGICINNACDPNPCGVNSECTLDENYNSVCSCEAGFEPDLSRICREVSGNSCNMPTMISLVDFSDEIISSLGESKSLSCETGAETIDKVYSFTLDTDTTLSVDLITSLFNYKLALAKGCGDDFIEEACGDNISNVNLTAGTYYLYVKTDDVGTFDIDFTLASSLYLKDTTIKDAVLNKAYQEEIMVAGGTAPYVVELKAGSILPDGLSLSGNKIMGTPLSITNENYSFIVTVTDNDGISKDFTINLNVVDNSVALKPKQGDLLINEIYSSANDDSNLDGVINQIDDEFIEIVNVSYKDLSLEGLSIWDSIDYSYRHIFSGNLESGKAIVIFGGGDLSNLTETNSMFVLASSNNLSLKDTSDTIRIIDENNVVLESVTYNATGIIGSINRNPDLSNSLFSPHTEVSNDNNSLFSPGKKANGDSF